MNHRRKFREKASARAVSATPAKGGAPLRPADGDRPTPQESVRRIVLGLAWLLGPPVASALLLTLAFPPAEVSWLAYLAPVPLLVSVARARSSRDAFRASMVGGVIFFGTNLYWVWPITVSGYLALVPYMALYWGVFGYLVCGMSRTLRLPLTLLAPVLWVALEYVRGRLLTGMPWLFVGHTQYENVLLIQTADAVGAYGASFLCLMTAGLVADLLVRPLYPRRPLSAAPLGAGPAEGGPGSARAGEPADPGRRFSPLLTGMVALTLAAWAATVGYGIWRTGQQTARPGPVVASVQTCVPQQVKQEARLKQIEQLEEAMLRDQLTMTDAAVAQAAAAGLTANLIVWPETMVPGILNRSFLEADLAAVLKDADMRLVYEYLQRRARGYWSQIADKARAVKAPILFGAHSVELQGAYRLPGGGFMTLGPRYNTALLISPDSKPHAADWTYAKVHLVPFGEFLPFKTAWPWLHDLLLTFTPYTYDYSLTPGAKDQEPCTLNYDGGQARFQVAICYEDAMAYRVREMVRPAAPGQTKAVDFLVNISNDGWFNGSIELDQHLNLCAFRAVENRVAIVRSVNTGISAIIAPDGRIEKTVSRDGRRRWVTGQIVGRLTLDDRLAPYTVTGDVFAGGCLAASAAGAVAAAAVAIRRAGKKEPSS